MNKPEKRIKTNKVLRHNQLPTRTRVTKVTAEELRCRPYKGVIFF